MIYRVTTLTFKKYQKQSLNKYLYSYNITILSTVLNCLGILSFTELGFGFI